MAAVPFAYAKLPKAFWDEERYGYLPIDAIVLYALMLDRMSLSEKNGWFDEHGNVYIYFTIDEIQRKMRCSRSKAVKLKKILLKEKLIRYEQKGKSDPHRIYVLPFFYGSEIRPVKSDNQTLGGIDNELHEVRISNPNNTENNKTESNILVQKSRTFFRQSCTF